MLRSADDLATLMLCSSVPVRNHTSSPRRRRYRATKSQAMISYAVPTWGSAFTYGIDEVM